METLAKKAESYVLRIRHALHKHPETRYETEWTRAFILSELKKISSIKKLRGKMTFRSHRSGGGIVGNLVFKKKLKTILFRADFDALPIQENTSLTFASKIPGKSHACGHDIHVAMLLGALKAIADNGIECPYNIRFVFQDAEENVGSAPIAMSGGKQLVKGDVLRNVSSAYALHINPGNEIPCGTFSSRSGAMLGNSGRIFFKIKTSGGHVARPHNGINALRVVQEIMNHLNSFAARNFDPNEPISLEPVVINAGQGTNVMPAEAEIWYGFRTLLPRKKHIQMTKTVIKEVRAIVKMLKAEIIEVKEIYGHPALINSDKIHGKVHKILSYHEQNYCETIPMLGGEDFAYYLYEVPGAMFQLGAHQKETGDFHSPTFNPNESVFWKGVLFWLLIATSE